MDQVLPEAYTTFWLAQRNLFVGLVVALIVSNVAVAAGLFWLAAIMGRR